MSSESPQFNSKRTLLTPDRGSNFDPWAYLDGLEIEQRLFDLATDEDLWAHLWPTIEKRKGSLDFWREYWQKSKQDYRITTLAGSSSMIQYLRRECLPLILASIAESSEGKSNTKALGEWLFKVLENQQTAPSTLRALANAVEEIRDGGGLAIADNLAIPPIREWKLNKSTQSCQVFASFCRLLIGRNELPTKKLLIESAYDENWLGIEERYFRRIIRDLGLSCLPRAFRGE